MDVEWDNVHEICLGQPGALTQTEEVALRTSYTFCLHSEMGSNDISMRTDLEINGGGELQHYLVHETFLGGSFSPSFR